MTTVEEEEVIQAGSVADALIRPQPRKRSLAARLIESLRGEAVAQSDRAPLWSAVFFGAGSGLYFALNTEPAVWVAVLPAVLAGALWLGARRAGRSRRMTLCLLMLASACGGMAVAKLRAEAVAAPVAPAPSAPVVVEGWVVDVDSPGARGARLVLAPVRISGLLPEETPERLRATIRDEPPPPGSPVRLFGVINPPPPPASPGAYDFSRNAYFQGLGGSLFALGAARRADLPPPPWRLALTMKVNAARYGLAQRIVDRLGPRTGGVAAAMTTGHETWTNEADLEAMRDSGLAHILSISGLHMAVVGGFVFFSARLMVAAWPWLALRVSGKKVAAGCGLIAVAAYLVVSGAPPPAERAAVTASIAFLAILADRQAISMHALAVAAVVVLLLQPEAIVTPGFQMSFAATAALVALVEVWPRRVRELNTPWLLAAPQRLAGWLAAAGAASLVAGMATGPFAMQHFNRTAMYGLLANMATAPIADFVMMPALAMGAALEPFGLGAPFLWLAGRGVDLMLAIGHWTAKLPGAVQTVASAPAAALPVAFVGVIFICLWRGRWRWLGLPFALAVLIWPRGPAPELWIGEAGVNAAYRSADKAFVVRRGVREFASDLWSRRRGLMLEAPGEGLWDCRRYYCAPAPGSDAPLAVWWGRAAPTADQLESLCRSASVVSLRPRTDRLPSACEGRLVLDGLDYLRGGSVELWRDGEHWRAVWAADLRGRRPWSRQADSSLSDTDG